MGDAQLAIRAMDMSRRLRIEPFHQAAVRFQPVPAASLDG
jgi:hypothetical protein